MIQHAFRRVRVRFRQPIDPAVLANLAGVKVLHLDSNQSVLLQVEGEMDALIKRVAELPVKDFETERPSLEEIFLAYYEGDRKDKQC